MRIPLDGRERHLLISNEMSFIDKLLNASRRHESLVCIGLDPDPALLPDGLDALEFGQAIIEATADQVCAFKLNLAFYEALGEEGQRILLETRRRIPEGVLAIGDGKRADIGNSSKAYARALFDQLGFDAITVNPYLGWDGIQPFVEVAKEYGKGVFVLVKTSNLSSGQVQDLVAEGRQVYAHLAELVSSWAEEVMGEHGYSSLGAVVAATFPRDAARIRALMPHCYFLVPGYGAQGGTAQDAIPSFNPDGTGAIVNSSRAVIYAYYQPPYAEEFGPERWEEAVESAVIAMNDDINSALLKHYPQARPAKPGDGRRSDVT